ncbi:MAG: glycoside hydrolase family 16 protein [Bacteroidetes bacterium]|nr:glycoside hydrolase family 16 protein [Bacteroidota bacterium]
MKIIPFVLALITNELIGQSLIENKNFTSILVDNFDTSISASIWTIRDSVRGPGNSGDSYYYCYLTKRPENLSIIKIENNGFLQLKSRVENLPVGSNCLSTGAEIISNQLFYPDNFFEIRYKLPLNCTTTTSSFWLYEGNGGECNLASPCINYREIDFLEYLGSKDTSTANIHYCNSSTPSCRNTINNGLGYYIPNTFSQFHTTLGRLSNNNIYHYLDNRLIMKNIKPTNHYNEGMRIWVSIYGDYAWSSQAITPYNNPATFLIDYIRVYTLTKACTTDVIKILDFNTFTWGLKKSYTLSNTTAIPTGIKINLMATDYIQFDPGFEVPLGTEVETWMLECD